jgi:glycosyltransferase involved in cell wall biosynthesis
MPCASVILPTLKRSCTLPYSLASVQAQTETSLEIFVVLDGATQACREVAATAAGNDQRIRVLDLPKAPGTGKANVDLAVSRATADLIFYIDDDDLWLPDHVASLAPLLRQADIVDSRVCSLDRHGRLHLGPCRGANQRMRELLFSEPSLKLIYDTHIAHRRDAYGRLSSWISGEPTGEAV